MKTTSTTHYSLSAQDQGTVANFREYSAPFKGAAFGAQSRESYDAMMRNVPVPQDVQFKAAIVGGIKGFWCTPPQPRAGVSILYLHGGVLWWDRQKPIDILRDILQSAYKRLFLSPTTVWRQNIHFQQPLKMRMPRISAYWQREPHKLSWLEILLGAV